MLYHCSNCGLVYFFRKLEDQKCLRCNATSKFLEIEITARAQEYSEAGGDITGIDVSVSVNG